MSRRQHHYRVAKGSATGAASRLDRPAVCVGHDLVARQAQCRQFVFSEYFYPTSILMRFIKNREIISLERGEAPKYKVNHFDPVSICTIRDRSPDSMG